MCYKSKKVYRSAIFKMEIAAGERIRYLFVLCWFYLMPYKSSSWPECFGVKSYRWRREQYSQNRTSGFLNILGSPLMEWINKPREITSRMSSMGDFILFEIISDRNTHACLLLAARCRGVLPISSVCWVWNENPWHLERASTQWIEPFSAAMWRGSLSFTSRWHKGDVSFSCRRISKI